MKRNDEEKKLKKMDKWNLEGRETEEKKKEIKKGRQKYDYEQWVTKNNKKNINAQ